MIIFDAAINNHDMSILLYRGWIQQWWGGGVVGVLQHPHFSESKLNKIQYLLVSCYGC